MLASSWSFYRAYSKDWVLTSAENCGQEASLGAKARTNIYVHRLRQAVFGSTLFGWSNGSQLGARQHSEALWFARDSFKLPRSSFVVGDKWEEQKGWRRPAFTGDCHRKKPVLLLQQQGACAVRWEQEQVRERHLEREGWRKPKPGREAKGEVVRASLHQHFLKWNKWFKIFN